LTRHPHRDRVSLSQKGRLKFLFTKPVGFRNFSEVTPHLKMGWTLVKPEGGDGNAPDAR
jgi:hypothetical protein